MVAIQFSLGLDTLRPLKPVWSASEIGSGSTLTSVPLVFEFSAALLQQYRNSMPALAAPLNRGAAFD